MRKMAIIYAIQMVGLMLLNCSKESTEPAYTGTSTFPLTVNSRWEYERNHYRKPFIDSTLADTQTYMVYRRVVRPDTVIDSNQLYIVDDSTSRVDSIDATPYVVRHWYNISESKLKEFAEIYIYPWEDSTPLFFPHPRILLDFPLSAGKAWIAYQMVLGNVYNSVVGIDYVTVGETPIKCDVVRSRLVDPGTNHQFYDSYWWYSNDGLIRNEFDYGIELIADSLGNPIDSVRSVEILELIDMQIQGG